MVFQAEKYKSRIRLPNLFYPVKQMMFFNLILQQKS